MKKPFAFFFIVTGLVAATIYLQKPEGRRRPASEDSLPMLLVCSGSASQPWVFSFSGEDERLRVYFSEDGATVNGTAQISLRGEGDSPVFEGVMNITGHRTSDGRRYELQGKTLTESVVMELVHGGTGTLYRDVGDSRPSERYEAHCQIQGAR